MITEHKACIVTVAKDEDNFILEWCEYHHKLGFDHIFVADNNNSNKPLRLNLDYVTIVPFNDVNIGFGKLPSMQVDIINQLLLLAEIDYEWCACIDVDEFFVLNKHNNIKDFIQYELIDKNKKMIIFDWIQYDDNDIIYENNRIGVRKQYTRKFSKQLIVNYGKTLFCIIDKGVRFDRNSGKTIHWPSRDTIKEYFELKHLNPNIGYIAHYRYKCLETYIKHKVKQQQFLNSHELKRLNPSKNIFLKFFENNKITEAKVKACIPLANKYKYKLSSDEIAYINDLLNKDTTNIESKPRVCVIACARDEEQFIEEWIEYYLNLGIEHIYIGDNNDKDKQLTINNDKVTVMHFNDVKFNGSYLDRKKVQSGLLNKLLDKARVEGYDYCLSIDVDEFLTTPLGSVHNLIKRCFNENVNSINIEWETYNDNEIIYEKDAVGKVRDVYTTKCHDISVIPDKPSLIYKCTKILFKIDNVSKCVSAHNINDVNNQINIPKSIACINHYRTKCLETYIKHKVAKQELLSSGLMKHTGNSLITGYFMYNCLTKEKLDAFYELYNKYKIKFSYADLKSLVKLYRKTK